MRRVGSRAEKRGPTGEEGRGRTQSVPPSPHRHMDVGDHAEKRAPVEQYSDPISHNEKLLWAMARGAAVRDKIKAMKEEAKIRPDMPTKRMLEILNTVCHIARL